MPPYTIFDHGSEPTAGAGANPPGTALLDFRRVTPIATEQPLKPAARGFDPRDSSLPDVVLRLPDLFATPQALSWWSWLANQVFWIGIVLGALLALALIWADRKPAPREMDEAPAWTSNHSAEHVDVSPPADFGDDGAPLAPDDAEPAPAPASPDVRTARGGEAFWDGNSDGSPNRAGPGEAAPVGKIINTVVPE